MGKIKNGRPRIYDFSKMKVGESRRFNKTNNENVRRSALSYCESKNLKWELKSYQHNEDTYLIRVA